VLKTSAVGARALISPLSRSRHGRWGYVVGPRVGFASSDNSQGSPCLSMLQLAAVRIEFLLLGNLRDHLPRHAEQIGYLPASSNSCRRIVSVLPGVFIRLSADLVTFRRASGSGRSSLKATGKGSGGVSVLASWRLVHIQEHGVDPSVSALTLPPRHYQRWPAHPRKRGRVLPSSSDAPSPEASKQKLHA
jgi:hypothetical protein